MRPSVTALFALLAGASAEWQAAQQAMHDCFTMNCPDGFDYELYSYSYMGDDDWLDFSDLCNSIQHNSEFLYSCQSADATCSECQSEVRTYTEVGYGHGLDCDLDCPAYGATAEDTHDGHDGHGCFEDPGEGIPGCECHASCASCGYDDDPTGPADCIACADGGAVVPVYDDGTGICPASSTSSSKKSSSSYNVVLIVIIVAAGLVAVAGAVLCGVVCCRKPAPAPVPQV